MNNKSSKKGRLWHGRPMLIYNFSKDKKNSPYNQNIILKWNTKNYNYINILKISKNMLDQNSFLFFTIFVLKLLLLLYLKIFIFKFNYYFWCYFLFYYKFDEPCLLCVFTCIFYVFIFSISIFLCVFYPYF